MLDYVRKSCFTCGMKKEIAIKYFGSQAKLARALGINKQAVHQWPDEIPIGRAYQIEVITNGKLRVERPAA